MYNPQHGIYSETMLTSNTANEDFEQRDNPSIYLSVLLAVHVFDCDVTEVHCEGAVCECDHYLRVVFYGIYEQQIPAYTSMKRKITFSDRLHFHSRFTLSFILSF